MKTAREASVLGAALAILLVLHAAPVAAGDQSNEELSGDIVTGSLVLGSYGITLLKDDDEGGRQFLRSTGVSLFVNTALRGAFNGTSWGKRPNGHDYAFPSGHTAFIMSSAQFLMDRYGWKYGLPAYAAVGYVSWVRVDTNHHHWRDIIAGAAVSYGISKLFVTPLDAMHIAPVIGPDWLGLRWERSF